MRLMIHEIDGQLATNQQFLEKSVPGLCRVASGFPQFAGHGHRLPKMLAAGQDP
jgi:hypothetical protein